MNKIKMGTVWNIRVCIDGASEKTLAETEKKIQEFIESLTGFEYFELNVDKINGDKSHNLRSVNKNNND